MRFRYTLPAAVLAAALIQASTNEAEAQVELSGTASVVNIRGGSFGLGARLGIPVRRSLEFTVRLEAGVDYYFPDCAVDCDVVGSQLDLIFQNRLGGRALVYYGAGGSFQSITLQDDLGELIDGDFWGVNLVLGGRYNEGETVQPFIEIRWTGLEEIDNQLALTLGVTVGAGG